MPEQDVDPSVHRRKLRNILRQLREDCGKKQNGTAAAMSWSVSKLIRIESGSVTISVNDLKALLQLYGITDPEYVDSLVEMAKLARQRSWLSSYNFQPVLVPGLLQLEEYARSIIMVVRGPKIPSRIEGLVELRTIRQEKVFSRSDIHLHFLIDESAIRRPVGGAEVMDRQIRHLLEVGQHDNVSISIIPFEAGFYRSIRVPFVVFQFGQPEDEAILYLEYPQGEEIVREDIPAADGETGSELTPPTYLEIFAELEQHTSEAKTKAILESALKDLQS